MTTRVAIVSGGAGGIGEEIVSRLTWEGFSVASLDLASPAGPRPGVLEVACDISDQADVDAAVARVRAELGPVTALVHCAAYQFVAPFEAITPEQWRRSFGVNVDGAMHLVRAVLEDLKSAEHGRVVMITSSSQWAPPPGMVHYVSTKGALTGMVRALATELGPFGISVNAVAPGLIATPHAVADIPPEHFEAVRSRQAIGRTGRPADIAAAVAFAVSDDAEFMTGQTMLVDGGESRM